MYRWAWAKTWAWNRPGGGTVGTGPPVNALAPVISGSPYTGQTLSCNGGSWSGAPPIVLTYQWKNAGVNLSGETASTYVLLVTDEGDAITCVVTATNGDGNASAASNTITPSAAPLVPANSVAPAVTGNAFTGQTLSCSTGTWSQSPTGYAYQWKRAGSSIGGATTSTYVVQVADVGQSVKCTVTASNAVGAGTPTDSNAVTPVGVPVNSVAPVVSGTTTTSSTLSCSTGSWSGSPSYTYQWYTGSAAFYPGFPAFFDAISGQTANTLSLASLESETVFCVVTATNLAGAGTPKESNEVGPVTAGAGGDFTADDMHDADDTAIVDHTGSPADYVMHPNSLAGATIKSNSLRMIDVSALIIATQTPPSADYSGEMTFRQQNNGTHFGNGVLIRLDSTLSTFLMARIRCNGDNIVEAYKCVSGSYGAIGSGASYTPINGHEYTIRISAAGTDVTVEVQHESDGFVEVITGSTGGDVAGAGHFGLQGGGSDNVTDGQPILSTRAF